jgi:membrane associated rhomboid family serine protease
MAKISMGNEVTQPPVSIGIIIACAAVFLTGNASFLLAGNAELLKLWPVSSGAFAPWQLISYGFLHGNFTHIFFNMFAVWMFGMVVEQVWGSKRFTLYYFTCLVGAAITQLVVLQLEGVIVPTIGASGAVFGLLLAYGVMFPNNRVMMIFLPVPIKAKWFVLIYGAAELVFGVAGTMKGVAHFAHLGGLFFGAGLLWWWGWRPGMTWKR